MTSEVLSGVKKLADSLPRSKANGYDSAQELHGNPGPQQDLVASDMPFEPVMAIDPKDEGTPDSWVPRHPELIRLTGR